MPDETGRPYWWERLTPERREYWFPHGMTPDTSDPRRCTDPAILAQVGQMVTDTLSEWSACEEEADQRRFGRHTTPERRTHVPLDPGSC
jgi:hypothetical protein